MLKGQKSQSERMADLFAEQNARDLPKNVGDEKTGEGNVVVVAFEVEVGLNASDTLAAAGRRFDQLRCPASIHAGHSFDSQRCRWFWRRTPRRVSMLMSTA